MHLSTALAIASTASLASAHPFRFARRAVPSFPAGASWDILLAKGDTNLKDVSGTASEGFSTIDIDLFDNDASTIADLKASNKQVICYFSAGSREDWRNDSSSFQSSDYGQDLQGWAGEKWVNIKSENVKNIMKQRIQWAAEKGCSAVDPDNVDGFVSLPDTLPPRRLFLTRHQQDNQDGFGYAQQDYADYVKFMAQEAASHNMAIGLKNAIDLIPSVIDVVQFAVNEQCHEFGECGKYKPFTDANKAVFNIEYGGNKCDSPAGVKLSILIKPEDQSLTSLGGTCAGSGETETPAQSSAVSSGTAKPTATATEDSEPTPTGSDDSEPTATGADDSEPTETEGAVTAAATTTRAFTRTTVAPTKVKTTVSRTAAPTKTRTGARPTSTLAGEEDNEQEQEGEQDNEQQEGEKDDQQKEGEDDNQQKEGEQDDQQDPEGEDDEE